MSTLKPLCLLASIAALTACGGGGSSSAPAPAPAPATPPAISNLQFTPSSAAVNEGGGMVNVSASLQFVDAGGDLASVTLNVFDVANVQVDAITKPITGAAGATSGTIGAQVQAGTGLAGQYSVQVYLTDGGGARSNTLASTFLVGSAGTFVPTGRLSASRGACAMTLLADGKVLLCGGSTNGGLGSAGGVLVPSADLYDPATGRWTATAGGMLLPRMVPTAALLANGRVLVSGGTDINNMPTASSELYDPATRAFSTVGGHATARANHALVTLPNGKVLAAGGRSAAGVWLNSAELFDPATGTWSPTGSMITPRGNFRMMPLADGRVLVMGGSANVTGYTETVEFYDPATGSFASAAAMNVARSGYMAATLPDGRILVAGGMGVPGLLGTLELYTPTTGTWSIPTALDAPRSFGAAVPLPGGKVLIMGGRDAAGTPIASAELYDPATQLSAATAAMAVPRTLNGRAVLLSTGKVLVTSSGDATAELYLP